MKWTPAFFSKVRAKPHGCCPKGQRSSAGPGVEIESGFEHRPRLRSALFATKDVKSASPSFRRLSSESQTKTSSLDLAGAFYLGSKGHSVLPVRRRKN